MDWTRSAVGTVQYAAREVYGNFHIGRDRVFHPVPSVRSPANPKGMQIGGEAAEKWIICSACPFLTWKKPFDVHTMLARCEENEW
jgi:hypothetical protein